MTKCQSESDKYDIFDANGCLAGDSNAVAVAGAESSGEGTRSTGIYPGSAALASHGTPDLTCVCYCNNKVLTRLGLCGMFGSVIDVNRVKRANDWSTGN
jgi:hypothetical protein